MTMRETALRYDSRFLLPLALLCVCAGASSARAAADLDGEDFRVYCGYLDAQEEPSVQALKKPEQRDAKVAKMAKLPVKQLRHHVERAAAFGATCDEIGKRLEKQAENAIRKALPGRIHLFVLDYSDPSHVVAAVTWKGLSKPKLVEEAALLAHVLARRTKIVRTIALRGIDPRAADPNADDATWFEAKISQMRADKIEKAKIADYAKTRYLRLFDGVVQR